MNMPLTTERLSQLILVKHDLLAQVYQLAQRQIEAVEAQDMDPLMSHLATKPTVLGHLPKVERVLDPFRSQDPEARVWNSAEDRRRCQITAERANVLLKEILALEQQAERQLSQARDATAIQLATANTAMAARSAYAAASPAPQGGLDLLSET